MALQAIHLFAFGVESMRVLIVGWVRRVGHVVATVALNTRRFALVATGAEALVIRRPASVQMAPVAGMNIY